MRTLTAAALTFLLICGCAPRTSVGAFVIGNYQPCQIHASCPALGATKLRSPTSLLSSLDELEEPSGSSSSLRRKADGSIDLDGFNPLSYKASSAASAPTNQVSMRKLQMQELIGELLNVGSDSERMQRVLQEYQTFLLEPLVDDDAFLGSDSIYTPDMNRTQRFQTYRSSMEERIAKARSPQVKRVLEAMRDFVLSHE